MASSVLLRAAVASTWEEEENSVILTPPHYTSKAASCMSLFLTLALALSLLHGVKTLRVAQKTKLPDQNRRWRPKYYVFPTQYIAFIPALGGRYTFKHLLTHMAEAVPKLFLGAPSPCCGGICWKMSPGDWERKKSRAISTIYCKHAIPPASGDLQELPGFTWACKHERKREREEEESSSVCRTVLWSWIVAAQASKTQ